jgi:arylsulfatase
VTRQPNFLLFVTDQHRADHLGCYGNLDVKTPHMDALAHKAANSTSSM